MGCGIEVEILLQIGVGWKDEKAFLGGKEAPREHLNMEEVSSHEAEGHPQDPQVASGSCLINAH